MSEGASNKIAEAYAAFRMAYIPAQEVQQAEQKVRENMRKLEQLVEAESQRTKDNVSKQGQAETKAKVAEIEKQRKAVEQAKKAALAEQKFDMDETNKAEKDALKRQQDEQKKKDKEKKDKKKEDEKTAGVLGNFLGMGAGRALMSMSGAIKSIFAMSATTFVAGVGVGMTALLAVIAKKSYDVARERATTDFRRNRMNEQGGNGTGWSNEQMDIMAKQIADVGTNSEAMAVKAQTAAMAFRNIKGDQFKRLIELADDVSAAMGTEMPDAAAKLGKALDDPIAAAEGGLEDLGVQFDMLEQAQVRSAVAARDYAGAQNLILDKLKEFKGASEEFAKTPEGQWKKLQNNVEQLGNKIGKLLLPIMSAIVDKLITVADWAEFVFDNFGDAADIAKQAVWVAFLELGDHCKDVFLLIAGHWWGTIKAMVAAGEWGWNKIRGIFDGRDAGHMGEKMAEAYEDGMGYFLKMAGKSGVVKDAEADLNKMLDDFKKKKQAQEDKNKERNKKPDGPGTDYKNTKAAFSFENVGFTELSKKIQNQLIPGSVEDKLNIQNKLTQENNAKADKGNEILSQIRDGIKNIGAGAVAVYG